MRRDRFRLQDIVEAADKIAEYLSGVDIEAFSGSDLLRDAVLRQMIIVGEAAFKISDEFRAVHPEIPWRQVAGFRHQLVHNYFGLDLDAVWKIARVDLPRLREQVVLILSNED